jgi:CMP-N,N'-diacetyllegionaminic acid synthase
MNPESDILEVLAVIPARGGSKSIPRKNLALLAGRPLISYSIAQALAAKLVTRVIVSTEDREIAEVALECGAEVPFARPEILAADDVLDLPVFEHVLQELRFREDYVPDLVVHLRPTAPWRPAGWIDSAIRLLSREKEADSVRSVSLVQQHPWRMFEIERSGCLRSIMLDKHSTPWLLRRQDLPPIYYYNCVIDVTRPGTLLEHQSMTGTHILPLILEADEVIDIDSPRDLAIAEALFGPRLRKSVGEAEDSGCDGR